MYVFHNYFGKRSNLKTKSFSAKTQSKLYINSTKKKNTLIFRTDMSKLCM